MYLTFINVGLTLGIFINMRLATLNVNVPNSLIKDKKLSLIIEEGKKEEIIFN